MKTIFTLIVQDLDAVVDVPILKLTNWQLLGLASIITGKNHSHLNTFMLFIIEVRLAIKGFSSHLFFVTLIIDMKVSCTLHLV